MEKQLKTAVSGRKQISGTTLDIYLYILTSKKPTGVREVWRKLKLSSPNLAQYHINKLVNHEQIENTPNGKYKANEVEQIAALKSFVWLRGKLVPRLVFYGAVLSGVLASNLILWPFRGDFRDVAVIFVSVFSLLAFFYEALNQYKGLIRVPS